MSYFNYLSARQYSLDSSNYGAPSNATINTDSLGDIVLNPSPSATVIVPSLALNAVEQGATTNPNITTDKYGDIYLNPDIDSSVLITSNLTFPQLTLNAVEQGATTNPTITTDQYGDIYLNPDIASSVQITSNLTITGSTLTLGNSSSGTISTAGNLNLNSSGDINLNGPTYIGSTSSSAISNFAFGNITFSDVNTTDAYYEYSPAINLQFVPSGVVIGATTSTPAIYYPITTAWAGITTTSGYAYTFHIYIFFFTQATGVIIQITRLLGWLLHKIKIIKQKYFFII